MPVRTDLEHVRLVDILIPVGDPGKAPLERLNARVVLDGLRKQLERCGAHPSKGFIVAVIHGEHYAPTGHFNVHAHALVYGRGMLQAIARLKRRKAYKKPLLRDVSGVTKKSPRVRMRRLRDVPRGLSYLLKSYWPNRVAITSKPGRSAKWGTIREPNHTRALLWLHRQSLDDITLLIGLSVGKHGLTRTGSVQQ